MLQEAFTCPASQKNVITESLALEKETVGLRVDTLPPVCLLGIFQVQNVEILRSPPCPASGTRPVLLLDADRLTGR